MKYKFKIGDRVRLTNDYCNAKKGMTGEIIEVNVNSPAYGVKFDKYFLGGHSCGNKCKSGYGHYVRECNLERITNNNNKIVITTDGETTLARLYNGDKVVKKATAECSPDDKYDFSTGAKIAFTRLISFFSKGDKVIGNKKAKKYTITGEGYIGAVEEVMLGTNEIRVGGFRVDPDCFDLYEEKKFVPHLDNNGKNSGEIGKGTKYTDAVGRKLFVGDVVEHFSNRGESYGDTIIVDEYLTYLKATKQFVMGIEMCCNDKTGEINDGWKLIKKRSFSDVKNGEEFYGIKYITEPDKE